MRIEIRDSDIAGLPKAETKEGADFRFYRRGIERCFPAVSSSYYANLGLSLGAAISLLEGKPKTSAETIILSANEAETLRRVLREYNIVNGKYSEAACHLHGLLAVIDDAGKLYRDEKRSAATKKIGWTAGKRGQTEPRADIFANYLLLIGHENATPTAAVRILQQRFNLQSPNAVIKGLRRTLNTLKKSFPDLVVDLPGEKII